MNDFGAQYYEWHRDIGMDYLSHGCWQDSLALMLWDAMQQEDYEHPLALEIGCACGALVKSLKSVFRNAIGVDISEHMISLGRQKFGLSDKELIAGSASNIDIPSGCASLVCSFVVLEHIPPDEIDAVLRECHRVLVPGGRLFLCIEAIKRGETLESHMHDPTHYNMQPMLYWGKKFQELGWVFDVESYDRYARSQHTFFQQYRWSTWTLLKP